MMTIKHYDQDAPAMCYTHIIARRPYTVRVFFPIDNAETMQQKIEQMLRFDLTNVSCELRQSQQTGSV